eukprot:scaffold1.g5515.t1
MEFKLEFSRWEDGKLVAKTLHEPDRWEVHSAEEVAVTLADLRLAVLQAPRQLVSGSAGNVGVGAAVWDGALVLAGYLAAQPRYKLVGARAVELGAGVGLVSAALARMGARVVATDLAKVLPLLEANLAANGFDPAGQPAEGQGWASAAELEWGKDGWMDTVARMADPPPDLVVAADACYVDGDDKSPSTPDFVQTCVGLCGPATRVLVAFERRAPEVRRVLLEEAHARFRRVEQVPLSRYPKPLRLEHVDIWEMGSPL